MLMNVRYIVHLYKIFSNWFSVEHGVESDNLVDRHWFHSHRLGNLTKRRVREGQMTSLILQYYINIQT